MTEQNPENAPETTATPATAQDPATEPARPETDWKAEARKWEQRAKENSAAARRLAEIEESQKTEAQRLMERAEAAEKAAASRDAELLRLRTALRFGISDEDAETFLTATDAETLTRQAERLAALRTPAGPRTPAPDPTQGSRSAGPADLDALIAEAEARGDVRTAIALKVRKQTAK